MLEISFQPFPGLQLQPFHVPYWGSQSGDNTVLQHERHQGKCHMKALARIYIWWPGINADIEELVSGCYECKQNQSKQPAAPLNPWSWPKHPWERFHLNFASLFLGWMFLILIDAHSKWTEAYDTHLANLQLLCRNSGPYSQDLVCLRPLH